MPNKERYKQAFRVLAVPQEITVTQEAIRKEKKRTCRKQVRYIALTALVAGILLIFSGGRDDALAGIMQEITYKTVLSDGSRVTYRKVIFPDDTVREYDDTKSFGKTMMWMEDDRIWLLQRTEEGTEKVDITDYCKDEGFYQYDFTDVKDSRVTHVVCAGGTLEAYGWIELLLDENGEVYKVSIRLTRGCKTLEDWGDIGEYFEQAAEDFGYDIEELEKHNREILSQIPFPDVWLERVRQKYHFIRYQNESIQMILPEE